MLVSRMVDSAFCRFSLVTPRLLTVCSRRFWIAPRFARMSETFSIAFLMVEMAVLAEEAVPTDRSAMDRPVTEQAVVMAMVMWRIC